MALKKNTAVTGFTFAMVTPAGVDVTTGTPVGYYTLDGGTQTAIGDVTPVHEGNGQWTVDLTAAEMNGDIVGLVFTHASAVTATFTIITEPTNLLVDVVAISGDSAAADNLEANYDGTGYADDTAPATQAQLGALANVGSAVHKSASGYTLTTGTQTANLYTDTGPLDQVRHTHTSTGGAIDLEYEFDIGAGTPSSIQVTGYVTGGNDDVPVYGYDWVSAGWVRIGTIAGSNAATDKVYSLDMFVTMVGTAANKGLVQIRFWEPSSLSSATLAIDQIFVAYNQGVEGYTGGYVWYDDSASNTGTVPGTDGVTGNEVSSEAAVESLLTSTGLHRVNISPGSTYTLATTHNNRLIKGHGATLELGGQDCDETHFQNMAVSGTCTAANEVEFHDCEIATVSTQKTHFYECTFDGTATFTLAGDYHIINCHSGVAGSGSPTFTKTAGQAITAEFRRWSGGVTFSGIEVGDVLTISGELGTVTLNGAGGSVEIRGTYKAVVDNRTGSPTLNLDGAIKGVDVADIVTQIGTAGDGLTGIAAVGSVTARVTANTDQINGNATSAANLEQSTLGVETGAAIAGTLSTTQMSTDLTETTDDHYKDSLLVFVSGTLARQSTAITAYNGTTKVLTYTATTEAPLNTDTFVIV